MIESKYDVAGIDEIDKKIILIDLDLSGTKSITNDAENVYKTWQAWYPGFRVIYFNTDVKWWELCSKDKGKTITFKEYTER